MASTVTIDTITYTHTRMHMYALKFRLNDNKVAGIKSRPS